MSKATVLGALESAMLCLPTKNQRRLRAAKEADHETQPALPPTQNAATKCTDYRYQLRLLATQLPLRQRSRRAPRPLLRVGLHARREAQAPQRSAERADLMQHAIDNYKRVRELPHEWELQSADEIIAPEPNED
jgi:hypothetical protein